MCRGLIGKNFGGRESGAGAEQSRVGTYRARLLTAWEQMGSPEGIIAPT
jgi:hypothetical protein